MSLSVIAPRERRRRKLKRRDRSSAGSALDQLRRPATSLGLATVPAPAPHSSLAASAVQAGRADARPVTDEIVDVERMEREGDLNGIIKYVQRFQADPDIVRAAMQALTDYCLKRPTSEDAAVEVKNLGGVEAVVSAMRLHIADETVTTMCAIAMRTIADTAENRVAMVEAGGVAAIGESLRLHGDNGELVKWCAAALRNIVDPVHVANGVLSVEQADFCLKAVIEEGIIGALVNALHAVQKADAVAKSKPTTVAPARNARSSDLSDEEGHDLMPVDDLPVAVDHFKAVRVLVMTLRTLAVGNGEVQAKIVVAGGLMVVEDARRRYMGDQAAADVLDQFGDLHGWLRSERTLEIVRAWRHAYFEQARQTLVRAEGCRRSTFVQLNNNTPYTLRRATCALKHGVWLVMPPEFIVPGEQGVPFGSGFQLGPQPTSTQSGEQSTSSFLVGTKGIVAYTVFVEEEARMVLLEMDWTNIVSLGDKRIWGDASAQSPISVECEATDSDHSVVTFNVARGAGTKRYWA